MSCHVVASRGRGSSRGRSAKPTPTAGGAASFFFVLCSAQNARNAVPRQPNGDYDDSAAAHTAIIHWPGNVHTGVFSPGVRLPLPCTYIHIHTYMPTYTYIHTYILACIL